MSCCYYRQGKCRFGSECQFEHTDSGPCQFGKSCWAGHAKFARKGDLPRGGNWITCAGCGNEIRGTATNVYFHRPDNDIECKDVGWFLDQDHLLNRAYCEMACIPDTANKGTRNKGQKSRQYTESAEGSEDDEDDEEDEEDEDDQDDEGEEEEEEESKKTQLELEEARKLWTEEKFSKLLKKTHSICHWNFNDILSFVKFTNTTNQELNKHLFLRSWLGPMRRWTKEEFLNCARLLLALYKKEGDKSPMSVFGVLNSAELTEYSYMNQIESGIITTIAEIEGFSDEDIVEWIKAKHEDEIDDLKEDDEAEFCKVVSGVIRATIPDYTRAGQRVRAIILKLFSSKKKQGKCFCDTFVCQCTQTVKVRSRHVRTLLAGVIKRLKLEEPHKQEFVQAACYKLWSYQQTWQDFGNYKFELADSAPRPQPTYSKPTKKQQKKKQKMNKFDPYDGPNIRSDESLYIDKEESWARASTMAKIRALRFGDDYGVKDQDIERWIALLDKGVMQLEVLNGHGWSPSETKWVELCGKFTNLKRIYWESCSMGTQGLEALVRASPKLEVISITGNSKISGHFKDDSLAVLFDRQLAPELKALIITDQFIDHKVLQRLKRCRPELMLTIGESEGDSMAEMFISSMIGGGLGIYDMDSDDEWFDSDFGSDYSDYSD